MRPWHIVEVKPREHRRHGPAADGASIEVFLPIGEPNIHTITEQSVMDVVGILLKGGYEPMSVTPQDAVWTFKKRGAPKLTLA